jgi:hypothetical protein
MKAFPSAELFRRAALGVAILLLAGCATSNPTPLPADGHCPANLPYHYVDPTHGFSLCLPGSVSQGNAGGYPAGTVVFTGFAVPSGTNLEQKRLAIVPGTDPDMQDATLHGHFTADGVTFRRATAGEGSAGHLTQYFIYTWTHGGKKLHFDFSLYSVNVNVYPPNNRPAQFDLPAQIRSMDHIMRTFRRVY